MSNQFEAEVIDIDDQGNELNDPMYKLEDGRIARVVGAVDHRATPSEVAKCINDLEKDLREGEEIVEIVCGDDCLYWAIVKVSV